MKNKKRKIIQSLIFLVIGIVLFWYAYRDMDFSGIKGVLNELNYFWLFVSFLLGMLNLYLRANRWRMIITPLNYRPKTLNLFISVLVLYMVNLVIPRGGEIARCGIVTRYENVPFTKLLGTVFIERLTDITAFFIILFVVLVSQFPLFQTLFSNSDLQMDFSNLKSKAIFTGIILGSLIAVFFVLKRFGIFRKIKNKIIRVKDDFVEGFKTITKIKGRWNYILQTFLIFLLWLLMFYVIFFAYEPTKDMSISAAIFIYAMGTLAYLLPIQAGIGVWHLIIIQCLLLFGIDKESGMMFALVAHTFTNLVYLIFGAIGFILLPVINNNSDNQSDSTQPTPEIS